MRKILDYIYCNAIVWFAKKFMDKNNNNSTNKDKK